MRSQTVTKPPSKPNKNDYKYNMIERIFSSPEPSILYSTSSENALYLLTNKSKILIFEKFLTNQNYLQLSLVPQLPKYENKIQTKEKKSQIWCDNTGNHVII